MGTFDGLENLIYCPYEDYNSGISTRLFFAPASWFAKINLPTLSNYQDSVTIQQGGVVFKKGAWGSVDVLIDENELKNYLDGNQQRKKNRSELNVYVLGFKAGILGFLEIYKNTPMVFGVIDSNGINWLIGNLRNRAFIDTGDVATGQKYEDNAGGAIKISCKAGVLRMMDSFETVELTGAFTRGFSFAFKS